MTASEVAVMRVTEERSRAEPESPAEPRRRRWRPTIAVAALFLVAVVSLMLLGGDDPGGPAAANPSEATQPPAQVRPDLSRGTPVVAAGPDGRMLLAFMETDIGLGDGGYTFGDGRTFVGTPQTTSIRFLVCDDPACADPVASGTVPIQPESENLVATLGPDGNPRFAYWAWNEGTMAVTCLDPACSDTEALVVAGVPRIVRVAFDAAGEPAAVYPVPTGDTPPDEGGQGLLSVSRSGGEPTDVGLQPRGGWPYPLLGIGPTDMPVILLRDNAPADTTDLLLITCRDPMCREGSNVVRLEAWPAAIWRAHDAHAILHDGQSVLVPYVRWAEGSPCCRSGRVDPWVGEVRVASCTPPDCSDLSVDSVATVPGFLEFVGTEHVGDGRTVLGWLACPAWQSTINPPSVHQACPQLTLTASTCGATSCTALTEFPAPEITGEGRVSMTVAGDGSPVFSWVADQLPHVAYCDGPDCSTILQRALVVD